MLIDTHAHINFNAFKNDADEVIKRSLENNIWLINVGSQYTTSKRAVEIAEKYPKGVYAAIGLHPIHLAEGIFKVKLDEEEIAFQTQDEHFNYGKYRELAKSPKVVAIGEIGLDHYYRPKTKTRIEQFKQKQKEFFLKQLDLAGELNLPIIFHSRVAHNDLLEIFNYKPKTTNYQLRGTMHGFVGTTEQLEKYLALGLYIGHNGIIFKKIEGIDFEENIRNTPLERILLETDCPYLTPLPAEGRNEPIYLKYIAERIAQIKNLSLEEIIQITTANAKKLFNI